ncbi:MAG: hypothetical protein ACEQSK_19760, partial [Sphingomonadaceae bacterium]
QRGAGGGPGYAVLNLTGRYQASAGWMLTAGINNLLDRRYASGGQLGAYALSATGGYTNAGEVGTSFMAPGAPRSYALTARYTF